MISIFELFKVGIGPSSSHTVGPMKAAAAFSDAVAKGAVSRVEVDLLGSLAWTGKGHGTDSAAILGLAGELPETVDPDAAERLVAVVREEKRLKLGKRRVIPFDPATDIRFDTVSPTPRHPNTLRLAAYDAEGKLLAEQRWCSVGGGFVVRE